MNKTTDRLEEQIDLYEKAVGMVWAWTLQDPAVREDALLQFDLIERDVELIDADEVIMEDLNNSNDRLSYEVYDVWELVDYDETTGIFEVKKDMIQEKVISALKLMEEFEA